MAAKRSGEPDMSTTPIEQLQLEALEERARLHRTASALRNRVNQTRDKFRLSKQAREHLAGVSALASLAGLIAGYGVAGMFVRH